MHALLNDSRDTAQLRLVLQTTVIAAAAGGLFYWGSFSWWWAVGYWMVWGSLFGDRVTTMLHTFIHRPLFKRRYSFLNGYVTWFIAPLFGQTPTSFYVHHIGMHHPEENLAADLSSTLKYQRDNFFHFLRYYFRFVLLGTPELVAYHWRKGRKKLAVRFVVGKLFFWAAVATLWAWRPQPTWVVLLIPYFLTDFMLMAGNFAQHSLVDPDQPDNDFKSTITCITARYNDRCFNDGYHTIHHFKPTAHYSELKAHYENNRELYGREGAIVFDGVDFIGVWFLLMTHRHAALAKYLVQLPGAPVLSQEEAVALLRRRVTPIRTQLTARAAKAAPSPILQAVAQ